MRTLSENQKRLNPEPDAGDLSNPLEVWENGNPTSEIPDTMKLEPKTGMIGRVADAGDLGSGNPTPYTLDVQVDAVSKGPSSLIKP